jgi:hypothetical protein
MQAAIDELLSRRKSVFFGSILKQQLAQGLADRCVETECTAIEAADVSVSNKTGASIETTDRSVSNKCEVV